MTPYPMIKFGGSSFLGMYLLFNHPEPPPSAKPSAPSPPTIACSAPQPSRWWSSSAPPPGSTEEMGAPVSHAVNEAPSDETIAGLLPRGRHGSAPTCCAPPSTASGAASRVLTGPELGHPHRLETILAGPAVEEVGHPAHTATTLSFRGAIVIVPGGPGGQNESDRRSSTLARQESSRR